MADVVTDAIVYPEPLDEWLPQDIKQVGLSWWYRLGWVGGNRGDQAGRKQQPRREQLAGGTSTAAHFRRAVGSAAGLPQAHAPQQGAACVHTKILF